MVPELIRRADAAAALVLFDAPAGSFVLFPDPGMARAMIAEDVVVADAVAEEAKTVEAPGLRFSGIRMTGEPRNDGDVGVYRVTHGDTSVRLDDVVVFLDPRRRLFGLEEPERQRADAHLGRALDAFPPRAGHPHRRVGFLHRFGYHVAAGGREESSVVAGVGGHGCHVGGLFRRLEPHVLLQVGIDAKAAGLDRRIRLAGSPFRAAAGDEVQRGDPLGGAERVVVTGRHEHDAVAETDVGGALGTGGQEHLRRGPMGVFLEEVMLDRPDRVDAELICELDLVQRLLEQAELGVLVPGTGELVFVEDSEFHARVRSEGRVGAGLPYHTRSSPPRAGNSRSPSRGGISPSGRLKPIGALTQLVARL